MKPPDDMPQRMGDFHQGALAMAQVLDITTAEYMRITNSEEWRKLTRKYRDEIRKKGKRKP